MGQERRSRSLPPHRKQCEDDLHRRYSSWSSEVIHVRFTFVFDGREEERGDLSTCDTLACFTCGSDLSPSACIFSFIRATFAAVPLVFAPFRPLLTAPPDLESKEEVKACKYFLIAISRFSFLFYSLSFLFLFSCFETRSPYVCNLGWLETHWAPPALIGLQKYTAMPSFTVLAIGLHKLHRTALVSIFT